MSNATTPKRARTRRFFVGFGLVALLLAAGVSYLADSSPDGLEAVTHRGCTTQGEQLRGQCIARSAGEHAFSDGPLAGYAVGGDAALTGIAGAIGVVVTLAAAGGLFWVLRRRPPHGGSADTGHGEG